MNLKKRNAVNKKKSCFKKTAEIKENDVGNISNTTNEKGKLKKATIQVDYWG